MYWHTKFKIYKETVIHLFLFQVLVFKYSDASVILILFILYIIASILFSFCVR